ncbi:Cytochrome P450 - like 10 [Theobroma cacao]|nr:Cytochrome P450 - like 10 [Theobroma cacao]
MAEKYGPIFTIKMGVYRALVVNNWETAKECLTTNDKAFASRPKTLAMELLSYDHAMFGFAPYGPYWRQMRKVATLELLSSYRLDRLKHVRQSEIKTSLKELYQHWSENKDSSDKVLVEMKAWFRDVTLNVILRMIVGKRIPSSDSDAEGERWKDALRDFFDLSGKFVISDALPFLKWLDIGGDERDKLVEESDIKKLVYLRAILKETLRLYPAGPLSLPHESMEDCIVSGYHIPAGTRLLINVYKIHRDPRVWSDPCEFQPERFLTTYKDFDVRGQNFELIPFGSGRRMCPGVSFALQVLELTLANLLQGFELGTPLDEPVDMSEAMGLTNLKASPLEVLITPRLPAVCY